MIKKGINRLRNYIWKMLRSCAVKKLRKRFTGPIPTILSCNCTGGVLYHDLGLPFNSPTINLYMPCADFIKFLENLDYYLSLQMSSYSGDIKRDYPIANLGELTLFLVHYLSVEQANKKWQQRKNRIDRNNIYVIATGRDGFNEELLQRFNKLPFRKKIFTHVPVDSPDNVHIKGFEDDGQVGGLMEPLPGGVRVIDQFDWVRWLSSIAQPYRMLVIGLSANHGGVETYIKNMLTHFSPGSFELYIPRKAEKMAYEDELSALGAKFIDVPSGRGWRFLQFYSGWNKVFKKYRFDVVYMNDCSVTGIDILRLAQLNCVPVRIFHAHSTAFDTPLTGLRAILEKINKHSIHKIATHLYSCSTAAAEWMFPKKSTYKLIPNAVNCNRFFYNANYRNAYRTELNIESNEILIGFIGRLSPQKQPDYFVKLCSGLQKTNANYRFILVGDGELRDEIETLISQYNFPAGSIQLLGVRADIPELLSAMDCLVMTSRYEGFPFVLVEAQATGLPCVVADTIPPETNIAGNVHFVSLASSCHAWKKSIETAISNAGDRTKHTQILIKEGYDLEGSVRNIESEIIYGLENGGAIK